jgi:hypothetical protein
MALEATLRSAAKHPVENASESRRLTGSRCLAVQLGSLQFPKLRLVEVSLLAGHIVSVGGPLLVGIERLASCLGRDRIGARACHRPSGYIAASWPSAAYWATVRLPRVRAFRFIRAFVLWFALFYVIFIALYLGVGPLIANR